MKLMTPILLICASSLFTCKAQAEDATAPRANQAQPTVRVDLPSGDGPFPALVLAPGQGYHMDLPALAATAQALASLGIAVFRFNWTYFSASPQGRPSPDLSAELNDLQSVIAAARKHPKIQAQRLSVGGKSLGSIVAWRAFAADSSLRSALLLTPVCSRPMKDGAAPVSVAQENYPAFENERRPTLWISGNKDPLCATPLLYKFAASGAASNRLALVGGDHGYEDRSLPKSMAEIAATRNITAVTAMATSFVAETVGEAGAAP